MKDNTKRLLLALYPVKGELFLNVPETALKYTLANLSTEGFRSLLYLLEKKQYIHTMRIEKKRYISLHDKGKQAIMSLFPALSQSDDWQGEWQAVVFKTSPKTDPQFRYLRSLLLKDGGVTLSRGVYIKPKEFSSKVSHVINTLYQPYVVVFSINKWHFGSEKPIIVDNFQLHELLNAYSSISNELDLLLVKFNDKKRLKDNEKDSISSIYARFYDFFREDDGLVHYYFPDHISGLQVLGRVQDILQKL